jgi:hypothetical protein
MTHYPTIDPAPADGLMIVEAASFSDHGRFYLDSAAMVEATRDLRIGERIVIMAPEASDEVVAAWQGFGWTVVLRDPALPIYKMPRIADAIATAQRVVLAANLPNLLGAVPALRALNKKVVGILRDQQTLPAGLRSMLAGNRQLAETTFRLPAAIESWRS